MTGQRPARPRWDAIEREADALLDSAGALGLMLRLVGSTGIRMHCMPAKAAMELEGRQAKDIDLVCAGRDRGAVRRLIEARGYEVDRDLLVAMEGARFAFRHPETGVELDLFVDRLQFCHTIELAERLRRHPRTIPVDDLLLQKLQIVELTPGDVRDTAVLLAAHPVSPETASGEEIDARYIAALLARDWGFHRTATANLRRLREDAGGAVSALDARGREIIDERAAALLAAVEAERKSVRWRVRARVGERMQWWQDVDERRETY